MDRIEGVDSRKYFTMTPNIIDEEYANLTPHEFRLLHHYYRVGNCWEGVRATARICNMSTAAVSRGRKGLQKAGWIIITENDHGVTIRVVDKWAENMMYFHDLKQAKRENGGVTQGNGGVTQGNGGVTQGNGGVTQGNKRISIKNNNKKNSIYNADQQFPPPTETDDMKIVPIEQQERVINIHTSLSAISSTFHGIGVNESEFMAASHALNDKGVTARDVDDFLVYWNSGGSWYTDGGKPMLKHVLNDWSKFDAWRTNGRKHKSGRSNTAVTRKNGRSKPSAKAPSRKVNTPKTVSFI